MNDILNTLQEFIVSAGPVSRIGVAVSGGLDSCVLLHALKQLSLSEAMYVVHVNHQLSSQSQQWEVFVGSLCERYQVPYYAHRVEVNNEGEGLEKAARDARYEAFSKTMQAGDLLLLAQHANDQAETLLYRMMRGAGSAGLSGMAAARPMADGHIGRPFLGVTRQRLEAYAREQGLSWVEDESNSDQAFDRNYLRQSVMPVLLERWPAAVEILARSASLVADSEGLLQEYVANDFVALSERVERLGFSIDLDALGVWSTQRQMAVLRYWFGVRYWSDSCEHRMPSLAQLNEVMRLISCREDAQPAVVIGESVVRRFHRRLYCLPAQSFSQLRDVGSTASRDLLIIDMADDTFLESGHTAVIGKGVLTVSAAGSDEAGCLSARHRYSVALRRGGERCKPIGRQHSQTLKKLFQEYHVEPWLRDHVPLIYHEGQLAAVGDYWVCEGFQASSCGDGYKMTWSISCSS